MRGMQMGCRRTPILPRVRCPRLRLRRRHQFRVVEMIKTATLRFRML